MLCCFLKPPRSVVQLNRAENCWPCRSCDRNSTHRVLRLNPQFSASNAVTEPWKSKRSPWHGVGASIPDILGESRCLLGFVRFRPYCFQPAKDLLLSCDWCPTNWTGHDASANSLVRSCPLLKFVASTQLRCMAPFSPSVIRS